MKKLCLLLVTLIFFTTKSKIYKKNHHNNLTFHERKFLNLAESLILQVFPLCCENSISLPTKSNYAHLHSNISHGDTDDELPHTHEEESEFAILHVHQACGKAYANLTKSKVYHSNKVYKGRCVKSSRRPLRNSLRHYSTTAQHPPPGKMGVPSTR